MGNVSAFCKILFFVPVVSWFMCSRVNRKLDLSPPFDIKKVVILPQLIFLDIQEKVYFELWPGSNLWSHCDTDVRQFCGTVVGESNFLVALGGELILVKLFSILMPLAAGDLVRAPVKTVRTVLFYNICSYNFFLNNLKRTLSIICQVAAIRSR